jgi:6-phosphofructokinase 1
MKRIAILTSGGDAPGMNAAVRAAVRCGIASGFETLGVRNGYTGLIAGEFATLGARDVGGVINRGGTMLGTSRCPAFMQRDGQLKALEQLRNAEIAALIVIGGNGSQAGATCLSQQGFPVVGIASTIDNDLAGTDISIGTTTALDTALDAVDRLRVTASSHHRAFLVEVMGRHSGFIALTVALAGGAEVAIVPEVELHPEMVAKRLREAYARGKSHAIAIVAEGAQLSATQLSQYFSEHRERLGFELRLTTLGHVQRGGAPGVFDRTLATRFGAAAIEHLRDGSHGVLVGMKNGAIAATPYADLAGAKKTFDRALYALADVLSQ